jgi:diguanylate cyclase (GGDEF)-like protein
LARLIEGKTFPVIVVIGDVDDLKTSDDNFGYTATYNLLRMTAEVLKSTFGSPAVVARIGSDEIAINLPSADEKTEAHILERLRVKLDATQALPQVQRPSLSSGLYIYFDGPFPTHNFSH